MQKPALQKLGERDFQGELRPQRGMSLACVQNRKMANVLKPGEGVRVSSAR